MSDEHPAAETVEVPRLTLASARDLLADYRREMERADATGPYLDEVSTTIQQLEDDLQTGGDNSKQS